MKTIARILAAALLLHIIIPTVAAAQFRRYTWLTKPAYCPPPPEQPLVQIALLLDTSNSMDGLIAQAKTQLWNIVKELASTKRNGQTPRIELALYEYGNDRIPVTAGYIRQVSPFTSDLDNISDALFKLTTNGGSEYSPMAIRHACMNLTWNQDSDNLRFLFIAGNERFAQGSVTIRQACEAAKQKNVSVTTIHCGDEATGRSDGWDGLADCTGGNYFCINTDTPQRFIATPYDTAIVRLNGKLNGTYMGYGAAGAAGKLNQQRQDANSSSMATANLADRAAAKVSAAYSNATWDVVDAVKSKKLDVATAKPADLPAELQQLQPAERVKKVEEITKQRAAIQKEMEEVEKKRQAYIAQEEAKDATSAAQKSTSLQSKISAALRQNATAKGYTFTK